MAVGSSPGNKLPLGSCDTEEIGWSEVDRLENGTMWPEDLGIKLEDAKMDEEYWKRVDGGQEPDEEIVRMMGPYRARHTFADGAAFYVQCDEYGGIDIVIGKVGDDEN